MTPTSRSRGWLALPYLTVYLLVFVAPLLYFFVISFWRVRLFRLVPDASLANYAKTLQAHSVSLVFTFEIAFTIAVIVTTLAFVFAYVVRFKAGRYGTPLLFVVLIALFGGYLTKIYVWKTILGQAGVINSALGLPGIINEPITFLLYNPVAVVITLSHYTLPLAILPIYGALRSIEDMPLRAARDLGASRFRVVWDVVLPQCHVDILIAFSLSLIFAAGDFVTPLLIDGPYTSMIGKLIQLQFGFHGDAAMAFTVIGICLVVIFVIGTLIFTVFRVR